MSALDDAEALFEADAALVHQIVHGDASTVVQTEGGPVRSLAKVVADYAPQVAGKQDASGKNAVSGYAGLASDYSLVLKNADGTVVSKLTTAATAARIYTMPDRNITVAGTDDVAAVLAKIGAANGIVPLDGSALISAVYLPSYVDDVLEYNTKALLLAADNGAGAGTGVKGKIYVVDADESDGGATNQYRWSGSAYVKMVSSPGTTDAIAEGSRLYFTEPRVLATILAGLSTATATVPTAADSVLSAIGKIVALLATKQNTASKDASGGYVGLTGFAINFKNAAGTFISSLVNSNTAARTYTFPDRDITVAGADEVAAVNAKIGAASGIAPLDSSSLIPAIYLPSYVDDVLEFDTKALLTAATVGAGGQAKGKIYLVDADESDSGATNQYRWSGSAYIKLVASPGTTDAVVEGATNKYFTTARVLATVLAGLSTATATVPTAADTILVAIGKLAALWGTKDATGGFVGLTGFAINFKNAAGTFTSSLANAATAARTYTFPDKNITVAGLADVLPTVATGLVFTDSTKAAATDTLLAILGKLQAQINVTPFDVMTFVGGKPAVSAKTLYIQAGRAFTIPANFAGSKVKSITAATGASVWTLTRNGSSIGTFSWAASGTTPTLATAGGAAINIAVGDELVLTAAATQDGTLADIGVHILANLT